MRYHGSVCCLIASFVLVAVGLGPVSAQEKKQETSRAVRPTKFFLFNTAPGGTYEIQKNSAPLATVSSSFFGVLLLNDNANTGDRYLFTLQGVNPQPPSTPTGFVAIGGTSGCADLSWNSNPEGDITGYTIYFDSLSVEGGQIASYRDSLEVTNTTAQICNFSDGTYYFALRARNAFGFRSGLTQEEAATITNEVVTQPPLPPQGVTAQQSAPTCVTVAWSPNGEPDLSGYVVYYGLQSVAGGQATSYSDSVNVNNVTTHDVCSLADGTYYFAVRAYNTSQQFSAYSTERPATVGSQDTTPPTVTIGSPIDGSVLVATVSVIVTATDNVGVAGVQLQIDGSDVGAEDTTAPYSISVDTKTLTDGLHAITAIARDDAGNSATANAVSVIADNDLDANHPRLLLTGGRLGDVRTKACIDSDGNIIVGCQSVSEWNDLFGFIAPFAQSGSYTGMRAWHFALVYKTLRDADYATRAISVLETEINNGMADERASEYENAAEYLRDAALVYDWLHIFMDSSQQAAVLSYINQLMSEIWDPSGNAFNTWSGRDIENAGSHRYYRFTMATAYAGVATAGENTPPVLFFSGTGYSNVVDFVLAKLDQQALPEWLNTNAQGGAWHQGDAYGLMAKTALVDLFSALRSTRDYFATTTAAADALFYHLYSVQPGDAVRHPGGDLVGDPEVRVNEADHELMLHIADALSGQTESEFAEYWMNNAPAPVFSGAIHPWRVLLASGARPERDYRTLPLAYSAPGLGWINSRTGWDADAISLSFVSSDNLQSPNQHQDQNSFVVYKNGWLAADAATYSASGTVRPSDIHNTITVDGASQRDGGGTGSIVKWEVNPDYHYVVGDASDAYYLGDKDAGGQRLLNTYLREIVHVMPGYAVVYDRVDATNPGATLTYFLQTRNQPNVNGVEVSATNGASKIFQRTLMPENAIIQTVREQGGPNGLDSWKVEVTPASPTANTNFMHVLFPTESSTTTMPSAVIVRATTNNMIGVKIDTGGEDVVVMFSSDPLGAPPAGGVIYDVRVTPQTKHLLSGLHPNAEYSVDVETSGLIRTITVSPGSGYTTTSAGVLNFEIRDEAVAQLMPR